MTAPALTFNAADHTYADAAGPLVSVTTVLKPLYAFDDWPEFRRAAALERGALVHAAILADHERDLDEAAFRRSCIAEAPYVDAFRSFRDQRRYVSLLHEYRVASPRHRVAGTIDSIGLLDGVPTILDYKTGRPADVCADLQLAGYLALATEWAAAGDTVLGDVLARYPAIRRMAIQLKPDGRFAVEEYRNPRDYRDFMLLVSAHHIIAGRTKPRRIEAA